MVQYIDKDALAAEIKARINDIEVSQKAGIIKKRDADMKITLFKSILSLIDTLEVKEVDYAPIDNDFERDAVQFCFDNGLNTTPRIAKTIAKHFFELGVLCPINNINIEEVKAAAKVWSEDDENTRGCDYIGAVVAERAFVACAEWLINKAQKGEEV